MTRQDGDYVSEERSTDLVLDVRSAEDFQRLHRPDSVNIPLEELARRIHELPPRDVPLTVYDADARRARWARSRLQARKRIVEEVIHGDAWLETARTETGPSLRHLWQPHSLLVEAVGLAGETWPSLAGRRLLDVACGTGRDAVFLATAGFQVEAWDVLPDALERCADLAKRNGVTVSTLCRNVETDPTITPESWDVVSCFNFLHRPLVPILAEAVKRGGLIVYETFVHPHRERFGKPSREAHELRPGELRSWFDGWQVLISREGRTGPRRIAASLAARKP